MSIQVGLNGFGRIGKCTFLQLLEEEMFDIKCINTSLSLDSIERYINRDSNHGRRNYKVDIFENNFIKINNHFIKVVNERELGKVEWDHFGVIYLIETTGVYLTKEELDKHQSRYVILSSPPKDDMKMFCFGVNHGTYKKQKILSVASCTTNCLAPFLQAADKIGSIESGSFITVHAATSSQNTTDSAHDKKRTNRSIFNNIIPHTTGASKCINQLIPSLQNKIVGTSVRVPVSIVSMIDLNLTFETKVKLEDFFHFLDKIKISEVIEVNTQNCVSSDFITTTTPTIVDKQNCYQIDDKSIKFTLWYDNEWSYCSQLIRMIKYIYCRSSSKNLFPGYV